MQGFVEQLEAEVGGQLPSDGQSQTHMHNIVLGTVKFRGTLIINFDKSIASI